MDTKASKHNLILMLTIFIILALGLGIYLAPLADGDELTQPVKFAELKASVRNFSEYKQGQDSASALKQAEAAMAIELPGQIVSDDYVQALCKDAEPEIAVRTKQYNVFCIPVDTTGIIWDYKYTTYKWNNLPNHLVLSYTKLPSPMTKAEFAKLESFANRFIGVPYVKGGSSPSTGFDCSGFVLYVMKSCGAAVSSASCEGQLEECWVIDPEYIAPGDLVFFTGTQNRESVSHVGIYLGDDKMIHAGMDGIGIVNLTSKYWTEHFECFARPLQ